MKQKGLWLTMIKKKFRSYNQQELKNICDLLCDNIESVLSTLGLDDYRDNSKMISMTCPIHNGDNESALNLYYEGDTYRGNWKCRTHQCEKHFKSSILGFIRGTISAQKYGWTQEGDKTCSFGEVVEFCKSFLDLDNTNKNIFNRISQEKNNFARIIDKIIEKPLEEKKISRESAIKNISIPSDYYLERGFSKEILSKYDVGLCENKAKPMYNRVVVPIYDDSGDYLVGCTGRSIFDKCEYCQSYHDPEEKCPSKEISWQFSKWKHSFGFKSQHYLYNFWNAKEHIYKDNYAIVVESPGNVWKLEENGVHNSVAIFGCNLSDRQKLILDSSGAMTLFLMMDNDEAGKRAAEEIKQKCENTYTVYIPTISAGDIAEMTENQIKTEIKDFIKERV